MQTRAASGDAFLVGNQARASDDSRVVAMISSANALHPSTWRGVEEAALPSTGGMLVVFSGFVEDGQEAQPLWLAGPRAQWLEFAGFVQEVCLRKGITPVVWPRLGDVLSDAPGLLTFLRGSDGGSWRFVVEPLALLTPEMHRNAPEHLDRLAEQLLGHHACAGVIVRRQDGSFPASSLAAMDRVLERAMAKGPVPVWTVRASA